VPRVASSGWAFSGADRRTGEVVCSEAGKALALNVLEGRRQALETVLARLSAAEIAQFAAAASKLLAGMPRDRTDAWRICRFCEHAVCRGSDCPVGSAVP
jgi:hypothetical protein